MNKFFDTAIGKSVETALWIVGAYALALVTAWLASFHWSASWLALGLPGVVNWLLYTAKVVVDKEIPNLPSSPALKLVPVATAVVDQVIAPLVDAPALPSDLPTLATGA